MPAAATRTAVRSTPIPAEWLQGLVVGASVLVVVYLALVPLAFLLWQSVHAQVAAGTVAPLSLDNFRNVYATVLQHWLETPSKPILGSQFNTIPILKA